MHNQIWHHFLSKTLKYFTNLQNWNFSVLWLKWTQIMEMKKTIFHGTYLNRTPYLFYHKNSKVFQWLSKSNFSVLWLKWTQTVELKQNKNFFHGKYSNVTLFFTGCKIRKYSYSNDFYIIGTFQFYWKIEHKQVKWNKITQDMCPYLVNRSNTSCE